MQIEAELFEAMRVPLGLDAIHVSVKAKLKVKSY
jgi:hypothetical protein